MDLRHLRYFLAVAEEHSFTRAAARVGIAQPPFSQQIQALERELGVELLARTKRHVALTAAGAVFAEQARFILARLAEAITVTQKVGRGLSGHIRIGFTESGCFHPTVTRILLEFRQTYPDLHLTLAENSSTDLARMVRDGELDAAFLRPPFQDDEVVAFAPLLRENLVVAVPRGHRLAARKTVALLDLADETFVFYHRRVRPGLTDAVIAACERAGFQPRMGQEAPQLTSTLNLVAAGLGISVVPESLRHLRKNEIAYLGLKGDAPQAALGLVSRVDERSAAVGNFIDLAHRAAAKSMNTP
ncbi:MAG: LysR family transcriptional regulator [Holophaga sp.]|nr:LysR family transcriptional regulator [Holophaga sp.]